ncbi:uncharacterized protein [Ptychodera flava]|uniref:uncharacterized protein n=1 Tax=Ptychodera flava TaxID=63121 RepID=UPI00396A5115
MMKLLKKVLICIAVSSLLSVVLMILYTGSDNKHLRKMSEPHWGALPSYIIRTFTSVKYQCHDRLLVKQSGMTMWEVCRDMDQGIVLDTSRYTDCRIFVSIMSPENKIDKNLISNFRAVFDRCEIIKLEVEEGKENLVKYLRDNIGQGDVELLKIDISGFLWSSFEDVLESGVLDNVKQLLLRVDMTDVEEDGVKELSTEKIEMTSFYRKNQLLENLQIVGFTLTSSNYIPSEKDEVGKAPCCYYGTWLQLGKKERKDSIDENTKVLNWQPDVRVLADGTNTTFQTPFVLQPLAVIPEEGKPDDWDGEVKRFLKYLRTNQMSCKESHHMGHDANDDGGWDVCFEPRIGLNSTTCLVYSIGIGDDWSFDEAMATYGCDVFAFDPSIHKPSHKHSERVWFYNFGLLDKNSDKHFGRSMISSNTQQWKVRTLEGLMAEMDHQNRKIDILKIDIEGAEWQSLYQMLERGTLQYVKQLVFEVHLWKPKPGREIADFQEKFSILKWLEEQGFRMWHWHENLCGDRVKLGYNYFFSETCCYELAWINTRYNDWWASEVS